MNRHPINARDQRRLGSLLGLVALAGALAMLSGCSSSTAPAPCTLATAAWVDTLATWPDGSPAALTYGCAGEPRRLTP